MRRSFCLGLAALFFHSPLMAMADPAPAASMPAQLQTPYHTEQEWIISDVCRNAFELLAYAKDKKGEAVTPAQVTLKEIPGGALTYDVSVKGAHVTAKARLQWPDSIWSPSAYVPFCQAAAQALNLPTAMPAASKGDPLQALLDFSDVAIQAENSRVSQWLADEPDNAAAHEQAALILGTLAMKENSGFFWDPRCACNQDCAHLAVARFLRAAAPISMEGRLAEIMIGLIVDTKTQTGHDLDALAAEKAPPPELAAWINGCRMRNTRDWRIVATPESASLFEQVEYFRAYCEMVNTDLGIAWVQAHSTTTRIDWTRIVLEMGFSVDAGHAFAQNSIGMEIRDQQATFPNKFSHDTLVSDLNQPSGDAVTFDNTGSGSPIVISDGMWAQFFQRHLCHAIAETGDFFANKWGVPENTQALDRAVDGKLSALELYPYLQLVQQFQRGAPANPGAAVALFTAHPESAPDCLVAMKLPADPVTSSLRLAVAQWFTPPVVQGTAYGAMSRAPEEGWSDAQLEHLYAIAPLQIVVAYMKLKRLYGTNFTLDQFQKVMGPLLDYDTQVINDAGSSVGLSLDQRAALLEKSAAINPDSFDDLGILYRDNHQDDKAAAAFQQWHDKAQDRVEVSNGIDWLVTYYYEHDEKDKALAIAKEAAEVYSYRGLETMMHLQEKMGNLDDAETCANDIKDRYSDSGPLAALYKREADKGDLRYQAKFDDLSLTVFPYGMKKVTVGSYSGPPTSGMKFAQTSGAMEGVGLSADQVVVALDGYGVQNQAQYTLVREMSESPDMQFIVWDGAGYRVINAHRPGRLFGVNLIDYQH